MSVGFVLLAIALNGAAALLSFWRRAVTVDGAVVGFVLSSIILLLGGFFYWTMLMLFFLTASLISRVGKTEKDKMELMHEKGDRRDWVQVMANGGVATVAVVLLVMTRRPAFGVAAAASFAVSNGDTWASELGVLSPQVPRSIVTGRPLQRGESGGVTRLGWSAAAVGALLIAIWFGPAIAVAGGVSIGRLTGVLGTAAGAQSVGLTYRVVPAWTTSASGASPLIVGVLVFAAGLLGSAIDSVLGATVQARYATEEGQVTERRYLGGRENHLARGWRWVTNDLVNLVSNLAASAAAGAVSLFL